MNMIKMQTLIPLQSYIPVPVIMVVWFFLFFCQPAHTQSRDASFPAPQFTLLDLEEIDHSLSDYQGQFVVIEWLNLRCRTTDRMYRSGAIPRIQQRLKEDAVWLSVYTKQMNDQGRLTPIQLNRQLEKRGGQQDAILIDEQGDMSALYGVRVVPYFVVINPEGRVIYEGALDELPDGNAVRTAEVLNYVVQAIDEGKRGKPVTYPTTEPYGCDVKSSRR